MRLAGTALRALISAGTVGGLVLATVQAPARATTSLPEITATYTVGSSPRALVITPDGRRVITANANSNSASVIDRLTGNVAPVPTGADPRKIAVSPDGMRAYVSNFNASPPSVTTVNVADATVVRTSTVAQPPWSIAVTPDGLSVIVSVALGGVGGIERLNAATGASNGFANITGGGFLVQAPNGTDFFVGRAGIFGMQRGSLLASGPMTTRNVLFTMGYSPAAAVFSPDSRTVFVGSRNFTGVGDQRPNLAVVDVASASVTSSTVLATSPQAVAISPNGSRVFVTLGDASSLGVFDTSGSLLDTTAISGTPNLVQVSADGAYVLVTTREGNLVVLDSSGTRVITTLTIGGDATDMQVSAAGSFAAISVGTTNRVIVVNLPPVPASGAEVPTAALQQYAPTDGSPCGTNAPDAVDFPGIAQLRTEGWSASWAQWPNEGRGGAVCTRQPYYTTRGTWAVQ